jgi:hypothetical protein
MPQPQDFGGLLDSLYNMRGSRILVTPFSGDRNNLSSMHAIYWQMWENQVTVQYNALSLNGRYPVAPITSIPDSVAAVDRGNYDRLIHNMPYGSRR